VKCSVLPLSMNDKFIPLLNLIDKELTEKGLFILEHQKQDMTFVLLPMLKSLQTNVLLV